MEPYQYDKETVIEVLCSNNKDEFLHTLNEIIKEKRFEADYDEVNLEVKDNCKGESLLHRVLKYKYPVTLRFVKKFAGKNPGLLKEQRYSLECSKSKVYNFRGQSPLHVAIVNGYAKAVKQILKIAAINNMTEDLLCIHATGEKFKNTVLMGQLPLSAAALVCRDEDFEVLEILFQDDTLRAKEYSSRTLSIIEDNLRIISIPNQEGDTVFHSLIKYADTHSDKINHIEPTFKFIWNKFAEYCQKLKSMKETENLESSKVHDVTDILSWENNSGLTPLRLSAKLGVSEIFDYLINIEGVYCFNNLIDGLFDIRKYDVTEFDRLISHTENLEECQKRKISILESVFDSRCSHKEAFQILDQELVKFILDKKWRAYQKILRLWMFLHTIFMCLFTASTIEKSRHYFLSQNNETSISFDVGEFSTAIVALFFVGGIIYFFFFSVCLKELIRRCITEPGNLKNSGIIFHNLDYIICLMFTSVGALVEFVLILLKIHWDYHLVFALISGWYFMLYFSPFQKDIVSFTYMIKSGFVEDFVPFAFVYCCLLISFTTILYMLFRGTDDVEEFETFLGSLLAMFKLGVGLNDIGMLNQARIPELAYTLFVVYVILSFIQLFNALIAVMSQTFSEVHNYRNSYVLYNKLKMIELFEDIVLFRVKSIYPFKTIFKRAKHWNDDIDNKGKKSERMGGSEKKNQERQVRFYSIMELDDNRDDKEEKKKKMKNTKRKLKKSSKTNPEKDIIFVNIQKCNKSSQYPEGTALSNW